MNRQSSFHSCRGSWLSVSWLILVLALPGLGSAFGTTSVIGRDWTKRNPLPTGDTIYAVAPGAPTTNAPIGGTRLVAVGGHGLILTSDDGSAWTARTSGVTTDLYDVMFVTTQLKYVAVGAGSTVLISVDGITWTASPAIGTDDLNSVVFTGTQIVAVGGTGTLGVTQTTATGVTWTRSTTPLPAGEFRQATSAGAFLYAVSANVKGAIFKASFSGGAWSWSKITATAGVTAADSPLSLIYTGSRFVLCSQSASGFNLWYSTNGTTWSASVLGLASPDLTVSHLNGTGSGVIGVGADGEVWTSADGINFNSLDRIPTGQPQFLHSGAKIGTTYVVTGEGGRVFSINPPGESAWTSRYATGVTVNITGVASNGTSFVAVGEDFSLTSADAATWTNQPQVGKSMLSATHTGSLYAAVGSGGWTSPDGITWTETLAPATSGTLNRVVWTGAQLVAVGFDDAAAKSQIYTSDTGAIWSKRTLAATSTKPLRGVAFSAGLIVAVGDGGMVQTSPDFGITWTKRAVVLTAGENFTDVVFGSNLFIATTSKGAIWTSANGTAWVKRKASSAGGFNRIILVGSQIIALGAGGTEAYSFGGISWTELNIGSSQAMQDAVYATKLVAVGTAGTILSSEGSQPTRPTLNFSVATSAVAEGVVGGTTTLTLNLAPVSSLPVTVLFSLSGTAVQGVSATSDYSVPLAPVLIPANAGSATITVTIKSDVLDEVNETAIFSLGAPTGDAVLGATSVHTLTINDDDQIPTFTAQPANVLTTVGSVVNFSATVAASGSTLPAATLTAAWKKNNAAAPGVVAGSVVVAMPAGATFNGALASAKLTDAGAYTVAVKNPSGTVTSAIAQLGVVDNTPATLAIAADTTATMLVKAAGNGLSYQWLKNGTPIQNSTDGRITGTATTKLVIKSLDLGDVDTYACRVTQTTSAGTLTANGATTALNVITSVPVVTTTVLPSTTVGQAYDFTPAASGSPTKWAMIGLPTGLTFNTTTGRITGKALVGVTVGTDYPVSLTATNILGTGPAKSVLLHVDPLPVNAVNSWTGLLARSSTLNANLGGRFELSITSAGSYSGKLIQGTHTTNLAGSVNFNPTGPLVTLTAPIAPPASTGLPAVALDVTIDPVAQTLTAQTYSGIDTAVITGWRSNLWVGSPPTNSIGIYNFYLDLFNHPAAPLPSAKTPMGFSFGSFTIAADGTYTVSGKVADGTAYAGTGVLGKTGAAGVNEVQIYSGLYSKAGSLHGTLNLTEVLNAGNYYNNRVGGDLTWSKPDQGTTLPDSNINRRSYGTGFGATPLTMRSTGGHYLDPTASGTYPVDTVGPIFGGLRSVTNNAKIDFNPSFVLTTGPSLGVTDPDAILTIGAPAVIANNPSGIVLTMSVSTGIFSGSATLTDPDPFTSSKTDTRTPTYFGIMVRFQGQSNVVNGTPFLQGRGFFNLEKLPEAGLLEPTKIGPSGNSPIQSGAVDFRRNP